MHKKRGESFAADPRRRRLGHEESNSAYGGTLGEKCPARQPRERRLCNASCEEGIREQAICCRTRLLESSSRVRQLTRVANVMLAARPWQRASAGVAPQLRSTCSPWAQTIAQRARFLRCSVKTAMSGTRLLATTRIELGLRLDVGHPFGDCGVHAGGVRCLRRFVVFQVWTCMVHPA